MTLPYDSCRLFIHLRNKAFAEAPPNGDTARPVGFDTDHGEPEAIGLTCDRVRNALKRLRETELIASAPREFETSWRESNPEAECNTVVMVQSCDDLTAATTLFIGG